MEMKTWASEVKKVIKEEEKIGRGRIRKRNINLAIVSANNHYAGFGPGTANIFRKMIGLPEVIWEKEETEEKDNKSHLSANLHQYHSKQRTMSDFMT